MGYNTTLVVLNDALDLIRQDSQFGEKVNRASSRCNMVRSPVDISVNGHANAASVIAVHHADITSVVAVGGNYGTILSSSMMGVQPHHTDEGKIKLLREFADTLGYNISKKRSR